MSELIEEISCVLVFEQFDELLTGSVNGIVRLWNMKTKKGIRYYKGHIGEITCLEAGKENFFISGSKDMTVKVWDKCSARLVRGSNKHGHHVKCALFFNSSENLIVTGSADKSILILGLDNKKLFWKLFHSGAVFCLEKLETKNLLFSGSADWSIKIWDMGTKTCVCTLNEHTGPIKSIKLIDENSIISSSIDNTLKLWSFRETRCNETVKMGLGYNSQILISKHFDLIIADADKNIHILHPFENLH
jgi:WD40 repeat protein